MTRLLANIAILSLVVGLAGGAVGRASEVKRRPNPWYGRAKIVYRLDNDDPNAHYTADDTATQLTVTIPRVGRATWEGSYKETLVEQNSCNTSSAQIVPYTDTTTTFGTGGGVLGAGVALIVLLPSLHRYDLDIYGGRIKARATQAGVLGGDDCSTLPPTVTATSVTPQGETLIGASAPRLTRNAHVLHGSYHKKLNARGSSSTGTITGGWTLSWRFVRRSG
jgi:hypothetical protein